jgi:hypothetical protein
LSARLPPTPSIGGPFDPLGNPFGGQQRPLGVHLPGAGPPVRTLPSTQNMMSRSVGSSRWSTGTLACRSMSGRNAKTDMQLVELARSCLSSLLMQASVSTFLHTLCTVSYMRVCVWFYWLTYLAHEGCSMTAHEDFGKTAAEGGALRMQVTENVWWYMTKTCTPIMNAVAP